MDVNSTDNWGKTALMQAADKKCTAVMELLVEKGAAINRQDRNGWSALTWVTLERNLEGMEMLIRKGGGPPRL